MRILITGSNGFIGRNLAVSLPEHELYLYDIDTDPALLDEYCKNAQFVFHLAGVNRPERPDEFMIGNVDFTALLLNTLERHNNVCPIVFSSSIQATLDNPYGHSKLAAETLLKEYGEKTGAPINIYRFPNLFGKWCRPNYNSAIATFCYNIARDLPITVNDPDTKLTVMYVDDVITELLGALHGKTSTLITHESTLGHVVGLLNEFKNSNKTLSVPDMCDTFTKKLYSTYLSYLPTDRFAYPLKSNVDNRGSFTEILRTKHHGQFSVNILKPGIVKGNHWHHTKVEKFLTVSGEGIVRFRRVDDAEIIEYRVSGDKHEVIDIPPGYTHNIENTGVTDMITFMWASECFDPEHPDTLFFEV